MEKNQIRLPEKVVMIGGSAGSLDVILQVFPKLASIETIAIILVLHRRNSDDNVLEELLRMKSRLEIKEIEDKTPLHSGCVYVAPPDYHLLMETNWVFSLDVSEKVNYSRPSIDVALDSAAGVLGNKLIAILLSGANNDGTEGLIAVKNKGGVVIVQSPDTADVPFMPEHAIQHATVDHVLSPMEMAAFIQDIVD